MKDEEQPTITPIETKPEGVQSVPIVTKKEEVQQVVNVPEEKPKSSEVAEDGKIKLKKIMFQLIHQMKKGCNKVICFNKFCKKNPFGNILVIILTRNRKKEPPRKR
jgi:hypothetical protein